MTSLYGHAQRRQVKARTLDRTGWRALMHTLRKARRSNATHARAVLALCDLERDSGTACEDMLVIRQFALGAYDREANACNCCDLGVLRASLAVKWYPLPRRAA